MTITLASLGMSCQTAYQLSRFSQEHSESAMFAKGPVDWLICRPRSLARWLKADMCGFEPGEITVRHGVAYWERFDIRFWHGFCRSPTPTWWGRLRKPLGRKVLQLDIDGTFQRELSKLAHQRDQFKNIDVAATRFFFSNTQDNLDGVVFGPGEEESFHLTEDGLEEVRDDLNRFFDAPTRVHFVTRSERATDSVMRRSDVSVFNQDSAEWTGDDVQWSCLIQSCLD